MNTDNYYIMSFGQGGGKMSNLFFKDVYKVKEKNLLQFQSNVADGKGLINPINIADHGTSTRIDAGYKTARDNYSKILEVFDKNKIGENTVVEVFASAGGTGSGFSSFIIPRLIERGTSVRLNFIWPYKSERNPLNKNAVQLFTGFKLDNDRVKGLYEYTKNGSDFSRLRVFPLCNDDALNTIVSRSGKESKNVSDTEINKMLVNIYRSIIMFPETYENDIGAGHVYDRMQHKEGLLQKGGGVIGYNSIYFDLSKGLSDDIKKKLHDLNTGKLSEAGDFAAIVSISKPKTPEKLHKAEEVLNEIRDYTGSLNYKANRYFGVAGRPDNLDGILIIGARSNLNNLLTMSRDLAVETAKRRINTKERDILSEDDIDILDNI